MTFVCSFLGFLLIIEDLLALNRFPAHHAAGRMEI